MRFFKDAGYRYELFLRYNRYIDLYPLRFLFIFFTPYIMTFILMFIFPDYKIYLLLPAIFDTIVLIVAMIFRQSSIDFFSDDDKNKTKKEVFSNKWLIRGRTQYIYIIPIDSFVIKIFAFNTKESSYAYIFPTDAECIREFVSNWGDWDLSSTIPASQEDIERYGLNIAEAKILLTKND